MATLREQYHDETLEEGRMTKVEKGVTPGKSLSSPLDWQLGKAADPATPTHMSSRKAELLALALTPARLDVLAWMMAAILPCAAVLNRLAGDCKSGFPPATVDGEETGGNW